MKKEVNQPKYTTAQIEMIGREAASLYGGELISYEVFTEQGEPTYRFKCVECGSSFYSDWKESEIEKIFPNL